MKNIRDFLSEHFQFLKVKLTTYLNRRVFVMEDGKGCNCQKCWSKKKKTTKAQSHLHVKERKPANFCITQSRCRRSCTNKFCKAQKGHTHLYKKKHLNRNCVFRDSICPLTTTVTLKMRSRSLKPISCLPCPNDNHVNLVGIRPLIQKILKIRSRPPKSNQFFVTTQL